MYVARICIRHFCQNFIPSYVIILRVRIVSLSLKFEALKVKENSSTRVFFVKPLDLLKEFLQICTYVYIGT
jgi:hypothetical protein